MPRPCPEQRRRGGKRPGAGAPKGNLNALKHGRRSRLLITLALLILNTPDLRRLLVETTLRRLARTPQERPALGRRLTRDAQRYAHLLAEQSNTDRLPTLRATLSNNKLSANNQNRSCPAPINQTAPSETAAPIALPAHPKGQHPGRKEPPIDPLPDTPPRRRLHLLRAYSQYLPHLQTGH